MKHAIVILAIVVAGIGAIGVRVVGEGRSALVEGDTAIADQRPRDAIAAWERSARWYFPGAPHVDEAYHRLRELAANNPTSLAPWRAIRSAARATRSLWTPHADDLAAADAAIARISVSGPGMNPGPSLSGPGQAEPARLAWHQARLADDLRPGVGATVLAVLGIVAWLAGIAVLLVRGLADDGRWVRRPTLVGLGITVAGLVAWATGLYMG